MKTIKELVQDSDNINKFMAQAASDKAENHLLAQIDDVYAQEVYLTLLISVAEASGQFDESAENPLTYVCKIAAAFDKAPDMQEILRRSLLIDEKVLTDYAVTLNQHGLQNLFLFDALTLMSIYAKDNSDALAYVTGIAEIFGTGKDGLQEILIIVKNTLNRKDGFEHKFEKINCFELLPYIRKNCKNIFIDAPDIFFADFESLTDFNSRFEHILTLANKKLVHFRNIYLHDKKFSCNISETENVEIDNCKFEKLTEDKVFEFEVNGDSYTFPDEIRLFTFKGIKTVTVINSAFFDMISNLIDYRSSSGVFFSEYNARGILMWSHTLNEFNLNKCTFKNCFFREMFPGANFGLYRDGNRYMTFIDKFSRNNFTLDEYIDNATINLERDWLTGGHNVKHVNIDDNIRENSFEP